MVTSFTTSLEVDVRRFFYLVARAGIDQVHLARLMQISPAQFSRVKHGLRTLTPEFREAATRALASCGVLHPSGRAYTSTELFDECVDTDVSNQVAMVS